MKIRNVEILLISLIMSVCFITIPAMAVDGSDIDGNGTPQSSAQVYKKTSDIDLSLDGWKKVNNDYYYVKSEKLLKKSWLRDNGTKYYFNSDGVMYKDRDISLQDDGGTESHYYRFNDDGSMITGWFKTPSYSYYYDNEGKAVIGLQTIDGSVYYFDNFGKIRINCYCEQDNKLN